MADIAKLGISVDATGLVKATTAIDNMEKAGAKAEKRAKSMGAAFDKSSKKTVQQINEANRRREQFAQRRRAKEAQQGRGDVKQAAETGRQVAQARVAALEREFKLAVARIKNAQARGFLSPIEAFKAGQQAAQQYNAGVIRTIDQGSGVGAFGGGLGKNAFTRIASSLKNVGAGASGAGMGVGRLNESLSSLVGQLAGANPVLSQASRVMGTFAIGSTMMIGVFAGLAGVILLYQNLTKAARETKKATKEASEALAEAARQRALGSLGERPEQLRLLRDEIERLNKALFFAEERERKSGVARGAVPAIRAQIEAVRAQIEEGELQITEIMRDAIEEREADRTAANEKRKQAVATAASILAQETKRLEDEFKERAKLRKKAAEDEAAFRRDQFNAATADARAFDENAALRAAQASVNADLKNLRDEAREAERAARTVERAWVNAFRSMGGELGAVLPLLANTIVLMRQMNRAGQEAEKLSLFSGAGAVGAGLGIGQRTGDPLGGALGGAAGGFIAAGGNPFGALIGGVAGLVGGLLGSSDEAEEAARRMEAARKKFIDNLNDFVEAAELAGGTDFERAVVSLRKALQEQIDAFFGEFSPTAFNALGQSRFIGAPQLTGSSQFALDFFIADLQRTLALMTPGTLAFNEFTKILETAILQVERLKEAEAERVAALKAEFELDLRMREARTEAERVMIALIDAQNAERKAAQDLLDQSIITEAQFRRLSGVLANEMTAALNAALNAARDIREDLALRGLAAAGGETGRIRLVMQQRREIRDATDLSPSDRALLEAVQAQELLAFDQQRELEKQTKLINDAANAEIAELQTQTTLAQEQLQTAQEALRVQEQAVEATKRVIETLTAFSDSLAVSAALSPFARLSAARSQFNTQLALAKGGDADAALALPGASRTFLDASRGFNASGPRFAADFDRVQLEILAVREQFRGRLSVEESVLAELRRQTAQLADQIEILNASKTSAATNAQAEIAALIATQNQANLLQRAWFNDLLISLERNRVEIVPRPAWWVNTNVAPIVRAQTETTDEVKRVVETLRAGFNRQETHLDAVEEAIEELGGKVRRGLEQAAIQ